jgi:hypothetical protein
MYRGTKQRWDALGDQKDKATAMVERRRTHGAKLIRGFATPGQLGVMHCPSEPTALTSRSRSCIVIRDLVQTNWSCTMAYSGQAWAWN